MSFFQEKGDDSNLQYDDAAFLYFIASALILTATTILTLIFRDLLSLRIQDATKLVKSGLYDRQIRNLSAKKRSQVFTLAFLVKIIVLAVLAFLIFIVYTESNKAENKMKGFDAFEILGLSRGATLRDVKKAYRKLAVEYHPDKNMGDPDAQAKFIRISKSFECLTNQQKRQNCLKYGNPDGVGSYRTGIGLPKLFIDKEYKWFVLPIVLMIFLVILPTVFIRWNNKNKSTNSNGISLENFPTMFSLIQQTSNHTKYTAMLLLASYKQLSEDLGYGPISNANRDRLMDEIQKHPEIAFPGLVSLNANQLNILWEIYKYCAGIQEFSHPQFAEILEHYIDISYSSIQLFAQKQAEGTELYGNPDWTITFLGVNIVEQLIALHRDYFNRSLYNKNKNSLWLTHLDLNQEQSQIALRYPRNPYQILAQNRIDQFVNLFAQARRATIKKQMEYLPFYQCKYKLLVDNKEVKSINRFDYAEVKYKVSRKSLSEGYCLLSKYPYPKKQVLYLLVVQKVDDRNNTLIHLQKIQFKGGKNYFIGTIPVRSEVAGILPIQFYFISDAYSGLDIFTPVNVTVDRPTLDQQNRRVQFHPQDINLQKTHKTFFEQLMELQADPEEHELSDSEDQ